MPTANPFAAYSPRDERGFSPARCNELVEVIAAEIVELTGCELRFARRGASGFLNFPGDRSYGLGGVEGCGHSLTQLERWIESKTAGQLDGGSYDALDEATAIEAVYRAADALRAAYKAIERIPYSFDHKPTGLDALLDEKLYPGDLDSLAAALTVKADEWQDSLDERQTEAAESDDRRRANPLESDFRACS